MLSVPSHSQRNDVAVRGFRDLNVNFHDTHKITTLLLLCFSYFTMLAWLGGIYVSKHVIEDWL